MKTVILFVQEDYQFSSKNWRQKLTELIFFSNNLRNMRCFNPICIFIFVYSIQLTVFISENLHYVCFWLIFCVLMKAKQAGEAKAVKLKGFKLSCGG